MRTRERKLAGLEVEMVALVPLGPVAPLAVHLRARRRAVSIGARPFFECEMSLKIDLRGFESGI